MGSAVLVRLGLFEPVLGLRPYADARVDSFLYDNHPCGTKDDIAGGDEMEAEVWHNPAVWHCILTSIAIQLGKFLDGFVYRASLVEVTNFTGTCKCHQSLPLKLESACTKSLRFQPHVHGVGFVSNKPKLPKFLESTLQSPLVFRLIDQGFNSSRIHGGERHPFLDFLLNRVGKCKRGLVSLVDQNPKEIRWLNKCQAGKLTLKYKTYMSCMI